MHCSGVTPDNGPAVNDHAVTSRNCVSDPRKNETLDVVTSKETKNLPPVRSLYSCHWTVPLVSVTVQSQLQYSLSYSTVSVTAQSQLQYSLSYSTVSVTVHLTQGKQQQRLVSLTLLRALTLLLLSMHANTNSYAEH